MFRIIVSNSPCYFFLASSVKPVDRNPIREKVLAYLISMAVQLKCLVVEQFEWLFHVVQYVSLCFLWK